jgi:hypothetical protein
MYNPKFWPLPLTELNLKDNGRDRSAQNGYPMGGTEEASLPVEGN